VTIVNHDRPYLSMIRLLMISLAACGASVQPMEPPAPPHVPSHPVTRPAMEPGLLPGFQVIEPKHWPTPAPPTSPATIIGRVLLDGKPVPHFGVLAGRVVEGRLQRARGDRCRGGRFAGDRTSAGASGPRDRRAGIPAPRHRGGDSQPARRWNLGDIELPQGHRVDGRVPRRSRNRSPARW